MAEARTPKHRAWYDRERLVLEMARALNGVQFDAFIVSGASGLVVAPELKLATARRFIYIRKVGEPSRNGDFLSEHDTLRRWVFVDDFISSGRTFSHVCKRVQAVKSATTCVGVLQYAAEDRPFFTPIGRMWERRGEWNLVGMKGTDIPGLTPFTHGIVTQFDRRWPTMTQLQREKYLSGDVAGAKQAWSQDNPPRSRRCGCGSGTCTGCGEFP